MATRTAVLSFSVSGGGELQGDPGVHKCRYVRPLEARLQPESTAVGGVSGHSVSRINPSLTACSWFRHIAIAVFIL